MTAVFAAKGTVQVSWLWVGRNRSRFGPPHFEGVIDGGTGAYAHASGEFTGSPLANGELRISARLR